MVERDKVDYRNEEKFDESKLQDLQTIKEFILHAKTGKSVRAPIAQMPDALIKLFQDKGTDSNSEVIEARGKFETLGIHESTQDNAIDDVQSDLNNIGVKINDAVTLAQAAGSGAPKGTFENLDALKERYPNGASGIYVTTNNGHWYYYNSEWQDGGTYQNTGIANNSVDWNKRTALGSGIIVSYATTQDNVINFDFKNRKIIIPAQTIFNYGRKQWTLSKQATVNMDFYESNTTGFITVITDADPTVVNVSGDPSFGFYDNNSRWDVTQNEIVFATFDLKNGRVFMNGEYAINGQKVLPFLNPIVTYFSDVTYLINDDGSMTVHFSNTNNPVWCDVSGWQSKVNPKAEYTLASSKALVFRMTDSSINIEDFSDLPHDGIVMLGNYNGTVVENKIRAVKGTGNYKYNAEVQPIAFYSGVVTTTRNSSQGGYDIHFSSYGASSGSTRLFFKNEQKNAAITLTQFDYTVPHAYALVINLQSSKLEVVNADNLQRGVQYALLVAHNTTLKYEALHINHEYELIDTEKVPLNKSIHYVGQDATMVGDEYWFFQESDDNHIDGGYVWRVNPDDFSDLGKIPQNLGHINGCDYRDGVLVAQNGVNTPAEIHLYKNPTKDLKSINYTDDANTMIVFDEGKKTNLRNNGTVCFGQDNKTIFYAYGSAGGVHVLKMLLGLGDNDLSDKTTDKTDVNHWGTFISGQKEDEYNGTVEVLQEYSSKIKGNTQVQGMAYDGYLYIAFTYGENQCFKFALRNNGDMEIVDIFKHNTTNYKGEPVVAEPEAIIIDQKRRCLVLGTRFASDAKLDKIVTFNL